LFKWVDFCCLWGYICTLLFNGGKGKEKVIEFRNLGVLGGLGGLDSLGGL
jgi:hypothetical protein